MSELSELFDKDPLSLTRTDRSKIIQKYREDRALFMRGEKKPKAASAPKIDLNTLDLDI